jgi:hypothetical protein
MERTSSWLDQGMQGFDPITVTVALPSWAVAVAGFVLVAFCLWILARAGRGGMTGTLSRLLLLAAADAAVWIAIDYRARANLAAERADLDRRAYELSERALAPGSALACLDAQAGDAVEASCERALFSSPESTATAVGYVSAQLVLLADANDFANRHGVNDDVAIAALRRAVELDRFGFVAHVIATRDGCRSPERCGAFAMLRDITRVSENLSAGKYEFFVLRHATEWPAVAANSSSSPFVANLVSPPSFASAPALTSPPLAASPPSSTSPPPAASPPALVSPPVVAHAPPAAATPTPPGPNPPPPAGTTLAKGTPPNKLFIPSSSSIPAVSIMNAEPGPSVEKNVKPPPKKPPAQTTQSRQPPNQANQANQSQTNQSQSNPPGQTGQAPPRNPPRATGSDTTTN